MEFSLPIYKIYRRENVSGEPQFSGADNGFAEEVPAPRRRSMQTIRFSFRPSRHTFR